MIEEIHAQLSAWGRWVVKSEAHKVGYPKCSAGFGDYMPNGSEYKSRPPSGIFTGADNMAAINTAVLTLGRDDRVLCAEYYVIGGGMTVVCARIGMAKSTLFDRLHRLQDRVSMALCEGALQVRSNLYHL
jgi:hypothetical protein